MELLSFNVEMLWYSLYFYLKQVFVSEQYFVHGVYTDNVANVQYFSELRGRVYIVAVSKNMISHCTDAAANAGSHPFAWTGLLLHVTICRIFIENKIHPALLGVPLCRVCFSSFLSASIAARCILGLLSLDEAVSPSLSVSSPFLLCVCYLLGLWYR